MGIAHVNWLTVGLLVISNFIMCFAWYGHLRTSAPRSLVAVILLSWSIALLEYCFAVPANRIGSKSGMSLEQLKITQEAVALLVFIPFSIFAMHQPVTWNYGAAIVCILAAVWFIFRG